MPSFNELTERLLAFRNDRDWEQFHNPKDCALSLVLEAAEVMEHFQWKQGKEMEEYIASHKEEIGDELADVMGWLLLLSHDMGIDLPEAMVCKLKKNETKYPVEKARGVATKWNRL